MMGDSKSRESRGTFGNENIAWVQLGADYDSMWHLVFTSRPCLLFPDPWNDSIQSDSASGVSFPPGSLSPAMTFFPNFRLPYPSGSLSGHHPHNSSNLTCLKLKSSAFLQIRSSDWEMSHPPRRPSHTPLYTVTHPSETPCS